MQAKFAVRNHGFPIGQPASFDTDDAAPSAVELLLAAVGGALTTGLQWRLSRQSIEVRNLEVVVKARGHNSLVFLGVEDKAAFETLLQALDVPAFAIKSPTITGRMRRREPLAVHEAEFLRAHTPRACKVALPGPYLLSRSMWVQKLSAAAYPTRESLCDDVVRILREELLELQALGVEIVQFDEPVLTELVFAGKAAKRTFMCAALAAASDPAAELQLAVELINRVVAGVSGTRTAVHVCRGNWSRDEDVLLSGDYAPLLPWLAKMQVNQFVLEYATPRAGPESLLAALPARCSVGFGAVNPRTEPTEDPADIVRRVTGLARLLGKDRIWLNPDCGFGTFAERPVATEQVAVAKMRILAAAARSLRGASR